MWAKYVFFREKLPLGGSQWPKMSNLNLKIIPAIELKHPEYLKICEFILMQQKQEKAEQ